MNFQNPRSLLSSGYWKGIFFLTLAWGIYGQPAAGQPQLSPQERTYLATLPTLKVPVIAHQAPLSLLEDGAPAGYLNELFAEVADSLGISVEWQSGLSYAATLAALKNGDVDALSDYSHRASRREYALVTTPVMEARFVAVGKKGGDRIRSVADLEHKRLVLVSNFQQTSTIRERYPDLDILVVENIDDAYRVLRTGDADFYIDNAIHAGYYLQTRLISDLAIAGELPDEQMGVLELRFAVARNRPTLRDLLQKGLDAISVERRRALADRWTNFSRDPGSALELTDTEQAWLRQHSIIQVVLDPAWAPVEYRDQSGAYLGISVDYLAHLEGLLGVKFNVVPGLSWTDAVRAVKHKAADMFASVSITPQREAHFVFTEPYIEMPIRIFSRRQVTYFGSLENLKGKRVAVAQGYAIQDWLTNDQPDLNLIPVDSPEEGLRRVAEGSVDAFVGNIVTANYYLRKLNLNNVHIAGETPYANRQVMAVRNDWPILAEILQKALTSMSDREHQAIYNRWMSIHFERAIDYRILWQAGAVVLVVLVTMLYWNRRLAREVGRRRSAENELLEHQRLLESRVDERTRELRVSEKRLREAQGIAGIGNWELDLDSGSMHWSDEIFRILEIDPEGCDVSYESYLARVHPEDRDFVDRAYQKSTATRMPYDIVYRLQMDDGRIKYVDQRAESSYSEDGRSLRTAGAVQDITARTLTEHQIHQAAAVFSSTAEGVAITDLQGMVIDVNPAFSEITGYGKAEIVGKNASILNSGRHDKGFYRAMWRSLEEVGLWRGEIWNRRQDGSVYPELLTISAVRDEDGLPTGYVSVGTDITSIKQTEARLQHLAHHDPLTGLPNRMLLNTRLEQSIRSSHRRQETMAVVFIDVDRFKHVNDSKGHLAGDSLLKELSERVRGQVRSSDTVARISGDEFVVLLEDVQSAECAARVVDKLMASVCRPYQIDGSKLSVTVSMGLSLYPDDGDDADVLLRNADAAMYRAKEEGRNTYRFFAHEMSEAVLEHAFLENAIRMAVENEEFHLVYQPKVSLPDGELIGLEALIRWQHPEKGAIPPVKFIPVAERSSIIRDIGAWVLKTACTQGAIWLNQGLEIGRIAVNIAGAQIQQDNFFEIVQSTLAETGLPPRNLELEVTESFVMRRAESGIGHLTRIRDLGVAISIDDFGTGYSSLSYLKQLPIDCLKIDRSFVSAIPKDANDMAICETIIAMGHALGMRTIAEGVEEPAHVEFLCAKGCEQAQGYFFGKPVSAREMERVLGGGKDGILTTSVG